jgi:hypothetical protein
MIHNDSKQVGNTVLNIHFTFKYLLIFYIFIKFVSPPPPFLGSKFIRLPAGHSRYRGSIPRKDNTFLTSPNRPDRLWGPPSLLFNGYGGTLSPGINRPGREFRHSFLSSAWLRMNGTIRLIPPPPLPHAVMVCTVAALPPSSPTTCPLDPVSKGLYLNIWCS